MAIALFSFPSLALHELCREGFGSDPDFISADRVRDGSGLRSALRPDLHAAAAARPLAPTVGSAIAVISDSFSVGIERRCRTNVRQS